MDVIRVDEWEMRRRFNCGRYQQRLGAGELTAKIGRVGHPSPVKSGQPHCTQSQEVFYLDSSGQEVARVHQYLRPDGKLGGRGLPDPKRLSEQGIIYRLHSGGIAPQTMKARLLFVINRIWAKVCTQLLRS